jgi:hypothetical protein
MYLLTDPFDGTGDSDFDSGYLWFVNKLFLLCPTYALGMGIFYISAVTRQVEECGKLDARFKDCGGDAPHLCCSSEPQF